MNISKYIVCKEEEYKKIEEELAFLKGIDVDLDIVQCDNDLYFYSQDYSLANTFKIKKRRESKGGFSGYDGGYHTDRWEYYPQFYRWLSVRNSRCLPSSPAPKNMCRGMLQFQT